MEQLTFDFFESSSDSAKQILLLVDGNNLMNRAYHATAHDKSRLMRCSDGRYTNAVNGFLRLLMKYMTQLKATHICVAFDDGKGFRRDIYPDYKFGRGGEDPELSEQFPLIQSVLKEIGVAAVSSKKYEADDLIATLSKRATAQGIDRTYILSNDKDLHQLIDNSVIQIVRKNIDDIYLDVSTFGELFKGLMPKQIIDLKALWGDTSDNLTGVDGIGEVSAFKLIQHYGTVEAVFENAENLEASFSRSRKKLLDPKAKMQASLFKNLATLVDNADEAGSVDDCIKSINKGLFSKVCEQLELNSLKKDIDREKFAI